MVKKLTFGDIKIGKYKFYRNQIPTFLKDTDIEMYKYLIRLLSVKKDITLYWLLT